MEIRIVDGIPDLVRVVPFSQRAYRTSLNALPAVDAVYLREALSEYRFNNGMETSLRRSYDADPLNISAGGYTTTAQDTLVWIPHDGRGCIINCKINSFSFIMDVFYAKLLGKSLQLTISASHASKALAVMIGQNQFQIYLPGFPDNRRIRFDLHTVRNRENTGCLQRSGPLYLDQAHSTGADFIDSL
jgi:hypothetical protein